VTGAFERNKTQNHVEQDLRTHFVEFQESKICLWAIGGTGTIVEVQVRHNARTTKQ